MIWLEVDPTTVRPGWSALFVLLAMGAALVLLYLSMRRQFRRIDVTRFQGGSAAGGAAPDGDDSAHAGETGQGETGQGETGQGETGQGETGQGETGQGRSDDHTGQASRR